MGGGGGAGEEQGGIPSDCRAVHKDPEMGYNDSEMQINGTRCSTFVGLSAGSGPFKGSTKPFLLFIFFRNRPNLKIFIIT